jgi:DNA-binding beta-propeller fold protein YncE
MTKRCRVREGAMTASDSFSYDGDRPGGTVRIRPSLTLLTLVFAGACSAQPTPLAPLLPPQVSIAPRTAVDAMLALHHALPSDDLPSPQLRPLPRGLSRTQRLLYVSEYRSSSVKIYARKGRGPAIIGTLVRAINHPGSLCFAPDGTLYVPNEKGATIAVYPFGRSTPSKVLTADKGGPTGCAVDAEGNLWVADFIGHKVYEFIGGKDKIGAAIEVSCPDSIAFDASGNMYVGLLGFTALGLCSPAHIEVFAPGQTVPFESITSGLYGEALLNDIAIGPDGTLYAVAEAGQTDVLVFPPGRTIPSRTLAFGDHRVVYLATSTSGRLYAGENDLAKKPFTYEITEFPPGARSPGRWRITQGLRMISGLAAWPAI